MEPIPNNADDIRALIALFPPEISAALEAAGDLDGLTEIVLDVGRRPAARYASAEIFLSPREVTYDDIDALIGKIGSFDLDNRAGLERTLHRISAIRNRRGRVIGLTCRVGRAVFGTLDLIADHVASGKSLLLLGKPGIGKTTMLREAARVLSVNRRVIIVDTSNEIGGDGDVPHPAVGNARRLQVRRPDLQHEVMIEAVENHNPEVIIIDEIGRELEARAARTIAERGVQLIATAHGRTLANLLMNPTLSDLIGGIQAVTLSDEEARRRGTQKVVLERSAPPTFDVLVEIVRRNEVIVYPDVAEAVDALVRGAELQPERRTRTKGGDILREKAPAPTLEENRSSLDPARLPREQENILAIAAESRPAKPAAAETRSTDLPAADFPPLRVCLYGISRVHLKKAAESLGIPAFPVRSPEEADALMTLRPLYRQRPSVIVEAETRGTPVYVLRSDTDEAIRKALLSLIGTKAG